MIKFPGVPYHIHWADKCPHKSRNHSENLFEEVNQKAIVKQRKVILF